MLHPFWQTFLNNSENYFSRREAHQNSGHGVEIAIFSKMFARVVVLSVHLQRFRTARAIYFFIAVRYILSHGSVHLSTLLVECLPWYCVLWASGRSKGAQLCRLLCSFSGVVHRTGSTFCFARLLPVWVIRRFAFRLLGGVGYTTDWYCFRSLHFSWLRACVSIPL